MPYTTYSNFGILVWAFKPARGIEGAYPIDKIDRIVTIRINSLFRMEVLMTFSFLKYMSALIVIASSGLLFSMEQLRLTAPADYVAIDMPDYNPYELAQPTCFDYCKAKINDNKKIFMAGGSALAAVGSGMLFGTANAPAATIFLGTFGTSVKGILPKSKDKQALKIAVAGGAMVAGAGIDYGLSYIGVDTHWAFFNLGLVGGMSTIKRVQKGHIKEKGAKNKNKAEKQSKIEDIV
jgi:hypothetical protein